MKLTDKQIDDILTRVLGRNRVDSSLTLQELENIGYEMSHELRVISIQWSNSISQYTKENQNDVTIQLNEYTHRVKLIQQYIDCAATKLLDAGFISYNKSKGSEKFRKEIALSSAIEGFAYLKEGLRDYPDLLEGYSAPLKSYEKWEKTPWAKQ